jgi:hypothetical protein
LVEANVWSAAVLFDAAGLRLFGYLDEWSNTMTDWIRTCQECGHQQVAKPPAEYKSESWRFLKCKKCKSESMDYGSQKRDPGDEDDDDYHEGENFG